MSNPTRCDLLITGANALDLSTPAGCIDAAIAIVGGHIAAVDTGAVPEDRWAAARHVDAAGAYVVPGFVDGHVHLSAVLGAATPYRATSEPSLFGGGGSTADIGRALHGFLTMPVPADVVEAAVTPVLWAMAAAGTTTVIDAGSAGIDGIVAAARRIGVRVSAGPSLHDVLLTDHGTLERVTDVDRAIGDAEAWLAEHPCRDGDPFEPVLTVTEPTFCSESMLAGLSALIDRAGVPVTFHSHETSESVADHDAAHGRAAIDRLADHGLLGPRCTLMHAGAVSDRDIEVLAATGTVVNVNPLGNAMLGFGTAADRAIARYLDADVRLVLGSDHTPAMVATGFDLVRAALMMVREAAGADNAITLEQALAMATTTSITVGQPADLAIIDHTGPHHTGVEHPVPGVALRARPGDVRTVIIGGRVIIDDHTLTTADPDDVTVAAGRAFQLIRAAA